jgi:hypothetical protein
MRATPNRIDAVILIVPKVQFYYNRWFDLASLFGYQEGSSFERSDRMSLSSWSALWTYLWYLIRHKWHIFVKCAANGLFWRGLTHDLSKLYPGEFMAHWRKFQMTNGYAGSVACGADMHDEFVRAWWLHQRRNEHHWQYWICLTSSGEHIPVPMSRRARIEMVCDWYAAGMAKGKPDIVKWYKEHKDRMLLHPDTRKWVDRNIDRILYDDTF